MATLQYGTVTFGNFHTLQFSQEAVYTPDEADYLYTKVTVAIRAVINRTNAPSDDTGAETPTATMNRIRKCLMTPCQQLTYTVGNEVLLQNPANGVSEDVRHGPRPLHLNILQLTNVTFLVEYAVETYLDECCTGQPLPYLSNRWSETHQIDQDWLTKRTVKGRIVFRADFINSKKFANGDNNQPPGPDFYRGIVASQVVLKPTFRRTGMEFVVQEDGLALDYTITDEEQYVEPPDGTVRFEASHTVTTTKGAVYSEQITCRCWGMVDTPKTTLLARAAEVVATRIRVGATKVRGGHVQDYLHQNTVELTVETFAEAGQQTYFQGLNIARPDNPGALDGIGGDRRKNSMPDPGMRGSAKLAMMAFDSYLQACAPALSPKLASTSVLSADATADDPDAPPVLAAVVATLPALATGYDQGAMYGGPYTEYRVDISYDTDRHVLQLPLASTSVTACTFATVAQPTMTKTARWSAERWGAPPALPDPNSTDANVVLLRTRYVPSEEQLAPDGQTVVYTYAGEYVYAVKDPTREQTFAGVPPYLADSFGSATTQTPALVHGIIDPEA